MEVSVGSEAAVEYIPEDEIQRLYLATLDIEVSFQKPKQQNATEFSADDMAGHFVQVYSNQMFSVGQSASFDYRGHYLTADIKGMQVLDLSHNKASNLGATMGILVEETDITFIKAANSHIKLKASKKKYV
jgi:vesicle-fusing ATPase